MFPGSDLLGDALSLLDTVTIQWQKYQGRTLNSIGIYTNAYADPVDVEVSLQAVDLKVYQQFGLDFKRQYYTIYVQADSISLDRDNPGDQFIIGNKVFQPVADVPWFDIDGWVSLIVVKIDTVVTNEN